MSGDRLRQRERERTVEIRPLGAPVYYTTAIMRKISLRHYWCVIAPDIIPIASGARGHRPKESYAGAYETEQNSHRERKRERGPLVVALLN